MLTMEQCLKERLPEDIAQAAVENLNRQSITIKDTESVGRYTLSCAFTWNETKEGHEYWDCVNRNFFHGIEIEIPTPNHLKQNTKDA